MINGLTRSSAYDIKKSQINHFNKLKHIITSNSTMLGFATDHSQMSSQSQRMYSNPSFQMLLSKKNHDRSRSFKKLEMNNQIKNANKKMVRSLIRITTRDSNYPETNDFHKKMGNSFINQKKRREQISRENPELAKRILTQKSHCSHLEDEKLFQKSRERIEMLQKFHAMKKFSNNSLLTFERSPKFGKNFGSKSFVKMKTQISLPTSSHKKQRVLNRRKKNVKKDKKIVPGRQNEDKKTEQQSLIKNLSNEKPETKKFNEEGTQTNVEAEKKKE